MKLRLHEAAMGALLALAASLAGGCGGSNHQVANAFTGPTPSSHAAFPIAAGVHAVDCAACHGTFASFTQFTCVGCHATAPTAAVHATVTGYAYDSVSCYGCHQDPTAHPFDHQGVSACAGCHDVGAAYAVLPVAGFTHPSTGGADCSGCHTTTGWTTAGTPSALSADASQALKLTALRPTYSGLSIVSLTPTQETLPMSMSHATSEVAVSTLGCADCHATAATGVFFPGRLHASLAAHGVAQPSACADCHVTSAPSGFVGPLATSPARAPASGEMKHDALAWIGGAPLGARLVTADCGVCHLSSSATTATWATDRAGASPARYHAALTAAGLAQPSSCVDCHANGKPAVLTGPTASLAAGLAFDHAAASAQADCSACHAGVAAWSGGRAHHAGDATPTSCLPCHAGERPTSTSGWLDPTFAASPFDYGTSLTGVLHGDGLDCAGCHTGPGTGGAWGGQERWQGGHFPHGTATVAVSTCAACHESQRPDRLLGQAAAATALGFDHAAAGTGDCLACHRATVTTGRYANLYGPSGTLPGGDWQGGVGSPQFITVGGFAVPQPPATAPTVQAGIANLPHPTSTSATCTSCHASGTGGMKASGYDHASNLAATACNACHEAGSPLLAAAWNGTTAQGSGAGDTRPFTLGTIVARRGAGGDSCTITLPNHFYPADCAECHAVPAGTGATATGAAYTSAWTFPHSTSKMSNPSTCNMCHVGQGCGR
jgi:hypothetical protein